MYLVPEKIISSMLNYLEAVERLGSTKIVEKTIRVPRCSLGRRTIEGHEDIDGRVVARERCEEEPPGSGHAILVAGEHVTRLEPYEPYDAVSYGTVVHETKLPGAETEYYVAWPDIRGVRLQMMGENGCRIVTKRPSWEPKPAWSPAQQKSIKKYAKRLAITDEIAAVLYDAGLREHFETFIENEIDVLAMPALTRREWAELGVPLEHRARIKQAHKNRHPEMWARRDSEVQ